MAEAFFLRAKLDRPFVEEGRPEEVFALLTIEPNAAVLTNAVSVWSGERRPRPDATV